METHTTNKRDRKLSEEEVSQAKKIHLMKKCHTGNEESTILPVVMSFEDKAISAENISYSNMSYFREELTKLVGPVNKIVRGSRNDLFIHPSSAQQKEEILKASYIGGHRVTCKITKREGEAKGIISNIPTCESEENLLTLLKSQRVTAAKRITSWREGQAWPTSKVILTFNGRLPEVIDLPEGPCLVEIYIPEPTECKKCWRFGHISKICKNEARCRKCGKDHDPDEPCIDKMKCLACSEKGHWIGQKECKTFIKRQKAIQVSFQEKISFGQALKKIEKEKEEDQDTNTEISALQAEMERMKSKMSKIENDMRKTPNQPEIETLFNKVEMIEENQKSVPIIIQEVNIIKKNIEDIQLSHAAILDFSGKMTKMEDSVEKLTSQLSWIINMMREKQVQITPMGGVLGSTNKNA